MRNFEATWTSVLIFGLAAGCDAVSPPSVLDHATLLAVRADPPRIAGSGRSRIDVLITDAAGAPQVMSSPKLSLEGAAPAGLDPSALFAGDQDGVYVVAPSEETLAAIRAAANLPDGAPIALTVAVEVPLDGRMGRATKLILLGGTAANPTIGAFKIDGSPADSEPLMVTAGTKPRFTADCKGDSELRYAWYSSVGELDQYRSPEMVLKAVASKEGVIVLVLRDAAGGTSYKIVPVEVR